MSIAYEVYVMYQHFTHTTIIFLMYILFEARHLGDNFGIDQYLTNYYGLNERRISKDIDVARDDWYINHG